MRDKGIRKKRVENLLRSTLSDILRHNIKNPRLNNVTITRINLSADLKHAKVYFNALTHVGEDRAKNEKECVEGFESAAKLIRYLMLKRTDLKYIPALRFIADRSDLNAEKIDSILQEIKEGNHNK